MICYTYCMKNLIFSHVNFIDKIDILPKLPMVLQKENIKLKTSENNCFIFHMSRISPLKIVHCGYTGHHICKGHYEQLTYSTI